MADVNDLLDKLAKLAALPLDQSTPMPPQLYHSQDLYELERSRLFAREWACPGMAAEISKPGDYLCFSIGDQPIFTIRGHDGELRSFSNVCLHRMMRLLDGHGSCSRIVCPYHAWTYEIDGQLLGAPHMKRTPGFEPRRHHLPEIRTEVWEGWIYVTLDPEAQSVATLLAPLQGVVGPYAMAGYVPVVTQDHVWNTNWKLLTENFMEGYHLPVAHRKTVGAWFPADDTSFPEERFDHFTYQTFTKTEGAKYGRAHPANVRLKDAWRFTSVMPTVFPAHMYVLAPDHLWYLSLRPKSLGEVHVRFGAALAPEVMNSLNDPQSFVGELVDFFDRVNEEDRIVVERLYQGTGAPLARPGRLSWLEREIHDFIHYLDRNLQQAAAKEPALALTSTPADEKTMTKKVLLVGESWVSAATHYKGFDQFGSVTFHLGAEPLVRALKGSEFDLTYMPAHEAVEQFPFEMAGLDGYRAIILSDIGANSLLLPPAVWLQSRTVANRLKLIKAWVEKGGGLLMVGGYFSFQGIDGKARWRRTPVEDVLPVTCLPYDDRVEIPEGTTASITDPAHPIMAGLGGAWPPLLGVNEVVVRERDDVEVLARLPQDQGGHPLLVIGRFGKGRTAAWTSDIGPHWLSPSFCEWDGYGKLWKNILGWITENSE